MNPLKKMRLAESKLQSRVITQQEAALKLGIALRTYQKYESKIAESLIPDHIIRLIDLGAFKLDYHKLKSKFSEDVYAWNDSHIENPNIRVLSNSASTIK